MKQSDIDRLVALVRATLGDKKNAKILFDYLVSSAADAGSPPAEPELLFRLFPSDKITSVEKARKKVEDDENSQVRKAKGQLKDAFRLFQSSPEGRRLPIRLQFKDDKYRLEYIPNEESAKKVWEPYLRGERDLLFVYPENLFFRNLEGRYFLRHLDLNDKRDIPESKLKFIPREHLPLQWSRQFVSSGDVMALLFMTRWFERAGVRTDHSVAYQTSNQIMANKNLVIFGNRRTFPFVSRQAQAAGFNFRIEDDRIVNSVPIAGDPPPDPPKKEDDASTSVSYVDAFGAPGFVRGLLSRVEDTKLNSWVTMITSNSGRFHEALAHHLTTEAGAAALLEWFAVEGDSTLPRCFEVLLQAAIEEGEETPRPTYSITLLSKRSYPTAKL